jgi:hypothetical protein
MVRIAKVISAGVFPRAAHMDKTIERKRKYTKAISHSGARITSLNRTGLPYLIFKE